MGLHKFFTKVTQEYKFDGQAAAAEHAKEVQAEFEAHCERAAEVRAARAEGRQVGDKPMGPIAKLKALKAAKHADVTHYVPVLGLDNAGKTEFIKCVSGKGDSSGKTDSVCRTLFPFSGPVPYEADSISMVDYGGGAVKAVNGGLHPEDLETHEERKSQGFFLDHILKPELNQQEQIIDRYPIIDMVRGMGKSPSCLGIVFVVDSCDNARLDEAAGLLFECLDEYFSGNDFMNSEKAGRIPLVVVCTKQDEAGAMPLEQIFERLGTMMNELSRPWMFVSWSSKDGAQDGMTFLQWLVTQDEDFIRYQTL